MPEVKAPEGQEPEGDQTPEGKGNTPDPKTPDAGNDNKTVTMTQAELDQMIQDRALRETRTKFGDYEDVKAKAARLDALEEEQKTELQKAQDKATAAETKAEEREQKANAKLLRAEIVAQAAAQGADVDLTVAYLAGSDAVSVDKDGNVTGVKEAVAAALKSKPNLKVTQKSGGPSGGEFGGGDNQTAADTIKALRAKGDKDSLREARTLEIELAMGAGG